MASVSRPRSAYIRDARSTSAVARCKNWASIHVGRLGRELAEAAIEIDEACPMLLSAGFHSLLFSTNIFALATDFFSQK